MSTLSKGKKEPEKKKRGHYRRVECPYCKKHVGNLENHIRLKHPAELEKEGKPLEPELTKEDLLGKKEPEPEGIRYRCGNCQAEIRKGEDTCWNCGQKLAWEAIESG